MKLLETLTDVGINESRSIRNGDDKIEKGERDNRDSWDDED